MNIHTEDQTLVMLAHEQLPLWQKLATQVHVTLCTRCRFRLTKIEGASRLLADTIRGHDLRRWQLPSAAGAVAAARITTAGLAVLLVLMVMIAIQAVHMTARLTSPRSMHPATTHDMGCRPGLPSDKCR